MPKAIPCIGYPSQCDAVEALLLDGMDRVAIAARTGIDLVRVDRLIWRARKRGSVDRPAPRRTDWSPEKLARARQIYAAGTQVMADALQVSVEDFLLAVGPEGASSLRALAAPTGSGAR